MDLIVWGGSCYNLPCGAVAVQCCTVSSASQCAVSLLIPLQLFSFCLFQLLSIAVSVISGKSLYLSCIVYLGSVMILKSDILFSEKPIAVTFENLAQCLQVSFIMFLKTLSSNILSNLNLFLKVLVLLEKFKKRGRGD